MNRDRKKVDIHRVKFSYSALNLFLVLVVHCQLSWTLMQSHQGSAPTNEFTLTGSNPDARIQIDSSSIIIVNVKPPVNEKDNLYKVSLRLLSMQLCDPTGADRLKIVYSDPTSIRTALWKVNVSFPSITASSLQSKQELELLDVQANQIVLIPEGRWVEGGMSSADLVATLYQDALDDGTCSSNMIPCSCSVDLSSHQKGSRSATTGTRCIPKSLECNGNPNCGLGCVSDESESVCPGMESSTPVSIPTSPCTTTPVPSTPASSSSTPNLGASGGAKSSLRTSISFINVITVSLAALLIR